MHNRSVLGDLSTCTVKTFLYPISTGTLYPQGHSFFRESWWNLSEFCPHAYSTLQHGLYCRCDELDTFLFLHLHLHLLLPSGWMLRSRQSTGLDRLQLHVPDGVWHRVPLAPAVLQETQQPWGGRCGGLQDRVEQHPVLQGGLNSTMFSKVGWTACGESPLESHISYRETAVHQNRSHFGTQVVKMINNL